MSKKNIIAIVITVLAFGTAAIVLYKGFFAGPAVVPELKSATAGPSVPSAQRILPNGGTLDFSPVKKYNSQEQLFNYPQVSPDEVTIPVQQLIK
jgi:hypothetical protein